MRLYIADTEQLAAGELFDELFRWVSPVRQKKIMALKFSRGKRLSLGAGVLLKLALADEGVDYAAVRFSYGEQGKPYLADSPHLHFNLAHSGTMALCAVAPQSVGCDVEQIAPLNENVALRFFHPSEYAALAALEGEEARRKFFFRLWTLKESFRKMTGLGLSLPLDEYPLEFSSAGRPLPQDFNGARCYFQEYDNITGYRVAVCSPIEDFPPQPHLVDLREVKISGVT